MKIKKYLIGTVVASVLAVSAIAFVAAQSPSPTASPVPPIRLPNMIVQIGPNGKATVRGTADQVGTGSLTLKSWGGDWTVNVSSLTKYEPGASLADVKVGDFVGVQGTVDQNSTWTINATIVHDRSQRSAIKNAENEIGNIKRESMPKNWQGTASDVSVSGSSLMLTVKGTVYTVNLASGATIVTKNFLPMQFSRVSNGDTVRVFGSVSGTTITASVLRDVSVK